MQNNTTAAGSLNDFAASGGPEVVNVLIAKKGNKKKKRVNLSGSLIPSASTNGLIHSASAVQQQRTPSSSRLPMSTNQGQFPSPAEQLFEPLQSSRDWNMDVDIDTLTDNVPIPSLDTASRDPQIHVQKAKSLFVRNLGGNVQRNVDVVKPITTRGASASAGGMWREGREELGLNVPPLMTYMSAGVEGVTNEVLEVWNYEDSGESHMLRDNVYCLRLVPVDSGNEDHVCEKQRNTVVGLCTFTSVVGKSNERLLCGCDARWERSCLFAYWSTVSLNSLSYCITLTTLCVIGYCQH